jgi:hypothetical protein
MIEKVFMDWRDLATCFTDGIGEKSGDALARAAIKRIKSTISGRSYDNRAGGAWKAQQHC